VRTLESQTHYPSLTSEKFGIEETTIFGYSIREAVGGVYFLSKSLFLTIMNLMVVCYRNHSSQP
jgi:hypothetical protein